MFCGAGSFKTLDDEAPSTPRQQQKKRKSNPYSSRGLDKFSTVLTELESRKEKIIASTAGSDDRQHVLVRFRHTESNDWVPIVVRLPEKDTADADDAKRGLRKTASMPTSPQPLLQAQTKDKPNYERVIAEDDKKAETLKRGGFLSWISLNRMRPQTYWPWAVVIVLISLVFFGRAFAVCCTSVWWYLVPTLNGQDLDTLRIVRGINRKRIVRKKSLSDEKVGGKVITSPLSSPRVVPSSNNNKEKKPKRLCSF